MIKNLNRTKTQDQEKMTITMNSNRSYKIVTKKSIYSSP